MNIYLLGKRINLPKLRNRLLLILLNSCITGAAFSQDLASVENLPVQGTLPKRSQNIKSVRDILTDLSSRYHVQFAINDKVIENKFADVTKLRTATLEEALTSLLKPLKLSYKKVDNYYVIQETATEQKEVKKIDRRTSFTNTSESTSLSAPTFEKIIQQLRIYSTIKAISIRGKVTDEANMGLPGVNVLLKGTTNGTTTDAEGNYSLSAPDGDGTLVFSYIGYATQEVPVNNQTVINVVLLGDVQSLQEVVVVGYGTQKRESLTGSIASISSKDLEQVKASTVSAALAGKIPGVSFRMPDGRPGASANIQIRNLGNPLYVIDGIQKDEGQFNNISPNDIESITVLKDASASVYGSRAANGVVIVTTKRGKAGSGNTVNVDAYYGWQNWSRFPETVNAYEWMLGKADAEMNQFGRTDITPAELEKWRAGTEKGYQSFDWYDFIIKANAPQSSINVNATGGSDRINYYLSVTRLDQSSVLGREFTFARTNIQSNVDAKISDRLKVGVQINGRIETRDQPGVPYADDYWMPRFALFRNRPTERPYANDNPNYPADIGHNESNWALLNKKISGYWREDWRVLQTNFTGEYQLPLKGLTAKGTYSYYIADRLMNGHEYTYDAYTYNDQTDEYVRTGGSTNPWRERGTHKNLEHVLQGQLSYNNTFGKHTVGGTFVAERIQRRELDVWVHSVPKTNVLPILQFADMDTYNDSDFEQARVGYVGRFTYDYANKYFLELAGRQDASWKFAPEKRWGFFPSVSAGWRITEEPFFQGLGLNVLNDLKIRASYGQLGDDDIQNGFGAYDYIVGYNYPASTVVLDGTVISGARQNRAVPTTNISWFTSTMGDIGLDYAFFDSRISGSLDYFYRKRSGLFQTRYDVLVPSELGYTLPAENLRSDAQTGGEVSLAYTSKIREVQFNIGGNVSYSRNRNLASYKPRFGNSWDNYRNSIEDRWSGTYWGYEVSGQFQSQEEINTYPVNIDGQGNKTLLPGDLIYNDVNNDGVINDYDQRPIGYPRDKNPTINFGINLSASWRGFDFRADFSGGTMYSYNQGWEMRWPFQNTGNLLSQFYEDRWHRADPFNMDSEWIPGKNPALRFNDGGHSNNSRNSDWWLTNVRYLRMRTMEIGYSIPEALLSRVKIKRARIYVNTYNLFSIDNVSKLGVEPEIMDENGLQYPQNRLVNIGTNLSF
ncbi:TonB-dependent receptor [Rhodocytophaga rosea]|uniref:TonB-dependent receptor n=1 Tax=Rhodocytophaga rosea TaxID=2704465 RepID=A0A6C0GPJ7_9BACT|nr:TonB-dependent receptor [Rhodocytophaga rosea]QHT69995.1 TonB-dependent receptor [Rhodocytophaga rosea]